MKVLLAEDDQISRLLLRRILAKVPDLEVVEASNGAAAWAMLDSGLQPDLCILDIMMPEMNGLDVLGRIRSDPRFKSLPVMCCSVLNDPATVRQAASLSINYYILKPFSHSTVLEQVQKVKRQMLAAQAVA